MAFVPDFFGQALNGLAYGVLLFLLSVGLTLIFGMLDVVNLAHGSYYMLGAYAGLTLIAVTDNFWLALLVAPVAVALIGAIVERTCLRPLYRRGPLDQVLLTFGLIYVFEDLVKWIWSGRIRSIPTPALFSGSVQVLGATIPSYRLFVIVFGLAIAVALWALIEKTRLGAIIRAGVFDSEMTAGMGINIDRVFTGVFAFGAPFSPGSPCPRSRSLAPDSRVRGRPASRPRIDAPGHLARGLQALRGRRRGRRHRLQPAVCLGRGRRQRAEGFRDHPGDARAHSAPDSGRRGAARTLRQASRDRRRCRR